jgi:hypothetical protein
MFPGTYSRMHSFRKSVGNTLKVSVGLVPIIILAAVFESFVTRFTGMPIWLSMFIIFGSLVFIVYYFIIYPQKIHRYAVPDEEDI